MESMTIAESKITSQGQISVPAKIRKKLGVAPGSVLEWHEKDGEIIVKRATQYTSEDIFAAIFPELQDGSPREVFTVEEMDKGIERLMREKHGRG